MTSRVINGERDYGRDLGDMSAGTRNGKDSKVEVAMDKRSAAARSYLRWNHQGGTFVPI